MHIMILSLGGNTDSHFNTGQHICIRMWTLHYSCVLLSDFHRQCPNCPNFLAAVGAEPSLQRIPLECQTQNLVFSIMPFVSKGTCFTNRWATLLKHYIKSSIQTFLQTIRTQKYFDTYLQSNNENKVQSAKEKQQTPVLSSLAKSQQLTLNRNLVPYAPSTFPVLFCSSQIKYRGEHTEFCQELIGFTCFIQKTVQQVSFLWLSIFKCLWLLHIPSHSITVTQSRTFHGKVDTSGKWQSKKHNTSLNL